MAVADHYEVGNLGEKILDALRRTGVDLDALSPLDLAPVDEFHIGGRAATVHVVGMMNLPVGAHVLDVGSGLGGLARYLATEARCRATGIDLTPEFVAVAQMLTECTGLTDRVDFRVGSALDLPWPEASFDAADDFPCGDEHSRPASALRRGRPRCPPRWRLRNLRCDERADRGNGVSRAMGGNGGNQFSRYARRDGQVARRGGLRRHP
ncbi:MAG: class I SAM-dependent methyltransferase [Alphaproteobacteria bacterium]|nr:class I SAM-dependent methyltransferase [Alphaproteobacteria bacterium]